jgi:hypothetical protein
MTTTSNDDAATFGEALIAALARQSWEELAACLDERVRFRALIPGGLCTSDNRISATSYLQKWFGDADRLELLSSQVQPMHDRLHVTYRFRAHEDQWYVVEQQAYCTVHDGHIEQIDLLCSGFRPEITSNQT